MGSDEDVATLAAAAAELLRAHFEKVRRVVVITRKPDALLGTLAEVLLQALGLPASIPVEERLGGSPDVLEAIVSVPEGTLVIAVDPSAPAGAGAALVDNGPISVTKVGERRFSVPVRTHLASEVEDRVYDDPRLLRERGWRRAADVLDGNPADILAGFTTKVARELSKSSVGEDSAIDAAAALFGIARGIDDFTSATVVGIEAGHGVAVQVQTNSDTKAIRETRKAITAPPNWNPQSAGNIPVSIAAYERAFESKVGFQASACQCGAMSYPPKTRCSACGTAGKFDLVPMPRKGTIYSIVEIHTPVPGKFVPYSLALVDVQDLPVRALVHVTDDAVGAEIGTEGRFVLRRVAVRSGISDYGFAIQMKDSSCEK